jgi:hypothetical protein
MFAMMMLPGLAMLNTGAAMMFWFGPWIEPPKPAKS